ncbi:hypothetical protein ACKUB1_02980 [Methanospirillum stamsii]|uniref:Uncharacterized protein n=1 Tax=Methanospirillum stamsii TaxID=1277351 RepID=A0A2V2N098_9EURY|nr:hypothetical protein [Methanospirillum stamsii]PWR69587.1 hypothetical protein DLD82_17595 [Methanospirillum stamsii]
MNIHLIDEVIFAAHEAIPEHSTLVSRRGIEEQILKNKEIYPFLHPITTEYRRSVISRVMNSRYPAWSEQRGVHKSSFVWIMKNPEENQ